MITHKGRTQTYAEWAKELGWSVEWVCGYNRLHHTLPPPRNLNARSVESDGCWERDKKAQQLVEERGPLTLQEIADHMGVTKERIRQIQDVVFRKIRDVDPWLAEQLEALDELRDQHDTREFLRRRQA